MGRPQTHPCPECRDNPRPGQQTCHACHALAMRIWRKAHQFSPEARRRANARSYAHVYRDRGKIARRPCAICGSPDSQMHHPDYSKPTQVVWLCFKHHHLLHHP